MESPFVYVDFMNEYVDSEFEIITEGYFANTTTYTGWLWIDEKPQYLSLCIFGIAGI